jgi:tRNA A37 threonylcarbamoyladenosine synthetase subunit TsaC/SUA5/YrdC
MKMQKEIKDRVDKIRKRVLEKRMKPLTSDVYDLLSYVDALEKTISESSKEAALIVKDVAQLRKLMAQQGNDPFGMRGVSRGQTNQDAQEFVKKFVVENKSIILEESEKTREKIIENFGEDSMEMMIFDSLMKQIEDFGDDECGDGERGGNSLGTKKQRVICYVSLYLN